MVVTAGVLTPFEIEFLYHIQRDCAWFMLVRLYAQHTILYSSLLPFYFFNLGLQKSQLRHEVLNKTIHFSSKDDMRKKASFTFTQWWKMKKKSSKSLRSQIFEIEIQFTKWNCRIYYWTEYFCNVQLILGFVCSVTFWPKIKLK